MRKKKQRLQNKLTKIGDSYLGVLDVGIYTDKPEDLEDTSHYVIYYNNETINYLEVTYALMEVFVGEYPEYYEMLSRWLKDTDQRDQEAFAVFTAFVQSLKSAVWQFLSSCNAAMRGGYPSLELLFYELWIADEAERKLKS